MAPESSTLKKGTLVVLIADLPGVAAGTSGRVGRAIGIKTTRYRVSFDNGVESLSVPEGKLVSPAAWAYIQDNAVEVSNGHLNHVPASAVPIAAATTPAEPAPVKDLSPPPVDKPSEPTVDAPAPTEGPSPAQGDTSTVDPRLAALTAKSRDARKSLGVDLGPEVVIDDTSGEVSDQDTTPETEVPVAETDPDPREESAAPMAELPDGYYPPDNRIADLLSSIRAD
jgi:hypothetical protein